MHTQSRADRRLIQAVVMATTTHDYAGEMLDIAGDSMLDAMTQTMMGIAAGELKGRTVYLVVHSASRGIIGLRGWQENICTPVAAIKAHATPYAKVLRSF